MIFPDKQFTIQYAVPHNVALTSFSHETLESQNFSKITRLLTFFSKFFASATQEWHKYVADKLRLQKIERMLLRDRPLH